MAKQADEQHQDRFLKFSDGLIRGKRMPLKLLARFRWERAANEKSAPDSFARQAPSDEKPFGVQDLPVRNNFESRKLKQSMHVSMQAKQ